MRPVGGGGNLWVPQHEIGGEREIEDMAGVCRDRERDVTFDV